MSDQSRTVEQSAILTNRETAVTDEQTANDDRTAGLQQTTTDGNRRRGTALVFAREFYPTARFRIVGTLSASITVAMLTEPTGRPVSVISQPDDYNGYVVSLNIGTAPVYLFVFTRRFLRSSGRYAFGTETTYFSSALNLLEVPIRRIDEQQ
ncbi:hypothetical protein [Halorussus halophilus]|uniref:hypothetical protein n=1 Tax=Halorussus halophilus TaxID=2650975 RepID=UPI0013011AB1|nr:hypothetical protein [Halorussus halophilus]